MSQDNGGAVTGAAQVCFTVELALLDPSLSEKMIQCLEVPDSAWYDLSQEGRWACSLL